MTFRKPSIEIRIGVGLGLALVVILLIAIASYRNTAQLIASSTAITHSYQRLIAVEQILSGLREGTASVRGFVITGKEEFLGPYFQARAAVRQALQNARALMADPTHRETLEALEKLADRRFELLDGSVRLRRKQGLEGVENLTITGKQTMDEIRSLVSTIMVEEERLLRQRQDDSRSKARQTLFFVVLGSLLAFAIVAGAAFLTSREMAERRQAERDLGKQRSLLESILEGIGDGVVVADSNEKFLVFNRAAEQMFGAGSTDTRSAEWSSQYGVFLPDGVTPLPANQLPLVQALAGEEVDQVELFVRHDQRPLGSWVSVTGRPLRDADGTVRAGIVVCRDITERRRAEQRLEDILDSMGEGVHGLDSDRKISFENPASAKMLGWEMRDLLGKPAHETIHHSRSDGSPYAKKDCPIYATLEDGKVRRVDDEVFWRKDGTCFPVEYVCSPARGGSGKGNGAVVVFRDITKRKLAEGEIQRLNGGLEQRVAEMAVLNRELEAFSYSVSHDLRAPVRHMIGFSELLAKHAAAVLDAKSVRYLETIAGAGRQMGQLIDDLLAFSKMGRAEMLRTRVSLDQLVADVRARLQTELDGRSVVWKVDALPEVQGDPSMLRVVLVNLLSNAVKYTRKRPVAQIEIGCLPDGNGEAVVFVRDNGVGFDMQYVNKLFGVFQRLHRSEDFEGTGIGLASIRRIIHRHGGRTWAEGTIDGGATFYFSMPTTLQEI